MTEEELKAWSADFESFHARFAHHFVRSEPREQSLKYLRGLMSTVCRKNSWQLAEVMGEHRPDSSQRLLYQAKWDEAGVRDELIAYVKEAFGSEEGIGVVDETGFVKKGSHSVGVKRQYTGTVGKVENCQIGVFLSYAVAEGQTLLDRRLYLPREWCENRERRQQAKVPDEVKFQTKPELAAAMLAHAWEQGVPMRWVTGDEVYGDSKALRETITAHEKLYVLAVSCHTLVWHSRWLAEEQRKTRVLVTVADVAMNLAAQQWQRFAVAEGEKGPRLYDWAALRVWENDKGHHPGSETWLLCRRSISDASELAYYFSNASADTTVQTLAAVAGQRYTIEQCIEEAKGETGLDEYEVRYWHSWHRHITLAMMAHAWLAVMRARAGKKSSTRSGRLDRTGSETFAGNRIALAVTLNPTAAGMVMLASQTAVRSTPQSLSPTFCISDGQTSLSYLRL
ncbi:MAG TPA: IS701 family transposase [Armatimonadetes bacterium]|nr:IS701 family transposase [Armatimonadota bacterium]